MDVLSRVRKWDKQATQMGYADHMDWISRLRGLDKQSTWMG